MNHQMLTKRIYFTISCIMLLVLFLFQGSSLVRQKYNRYDENIYANETAPFDAGTQFTVQILPPYCRIRMLLSSLSAIRILHPVQQSVNGVPIPSVIF
jgi:hypothetical protein